MNVPPAHRAQQIAWRSLSRLRGEKITYYVNATTSIVIEGAVLTRPKDKAESVGRVKVLASHWDWLIAPDALANDTGLVIPSRGHWIIRALDDQRFDIQPPDGNERAWRWSDGSKSNRRIHCVERGEV